MRAVIQRVSDAAVVVDDRVVGTIGAGLVVLVGVMLGDGPADAVAVASKISGLRIFRDRQQRMNLSVGDIGGSVLVVSQFTLAGDVRRGRRPSFASAETPELAEPLVAAVCDHLVADGIRVERGVFGADMAVSLVNDGPVTIIIETREGVVV
jgi:D-tyrosyl-tRNA(Tyr) deacylase